MDPRRPAWRIQSPPRHEHYRSPGRGSPAERANCSGFSRCITRHWGQNAQQVIVPGSRPVGVYTLHRLLPLLIPIAFDNASDASDKSRGARTRCSGAWKPLTNRFGANRNGINLLDLWSGSLWRMSRFSELKVTGTVFVRFSNSPITKSQGVYERGRTATSSVCGVRWNSSFSYCSPAGADSSC